MFTLVYTILRLLRYVESAVRASLGAPHYAASTFGTSQHA